MAVIATLRRFGRGQREPALLVHSLRTYLVMVVLAALLPALVTAVITGASAINRTHAEIDQRLQGMAHALARIMDHDIDGLTRLLLTLTESPPLSPGTDLAIPRGRANGIAKALGTQIGIYDRRGALMSGTPGGAGRAELPALPAPLRALMGDTMRPVVSRLPPSGDGDDAITMLVVPVAMDGTVTAYLGMSLSPRLIADVMLGPTPRPDRIVVVIDNLGLVAASATVLRDGLAGRFGTLLQACPAPGQTAAEKRWIDGRPQFVACAPLALAPGWQVVYGEDVANVDSGIVSPLLDSIAALLLAGCVSLLLAAVLGGRLSAPLRQLTSQARAVAIGAERPREPMRPSIVAEFESLRLGMARADAVLRRRGAAERMALREARTGHELLASVVNAVAEAITVKDVDLRHVLVNRAALLGGPTALEEWQVLGRTSADLLPHAVAGRIDATDRAVLASGQMTSFELELPQPEGPSRWISITTTPWKNADGRVVGVVNVTRDITEPRAASRRLSGLQADLLRATRLSAMGAMASGLAHEINQPLAAATNYVNAARRLLGRSRAGDAEALVAAMDASSDAEQQLLRAGAIVRRLRDFVERGEAQLEPQDIVELIGEACDLARGDGLAPGVELRISLGAELTTEPGGSGSICVIPSQRRVLADRTQLEQVLLNLIRNASDALAGPPAPDPGGVITVAAHRRPDGLVITVSDNGPGIAPSVAERLFQPFVSTKTGGMGIGLVICRTIVEGHGGRLDLDTRAMSGATFRIVLPISRPAGD